MVRFFPKRHKKANRGRGEKWDWVYKTGMRTRGAAATNKSPAAGKTESGILENSCNTYRYALKPCCGPGVYLARVNRSLGKRPRCGLLRQILVRRLHLTHFRDCPYDEGKIAVERTVKHIADIASSV